MNLLRPILISLSPNTSKKDVLLALRLLFRPDKWLSGSAIDALEETFREYLRTKYAVSFNSGRSSLFAILKCLRIGEGADPSSPKGRSQKDEVLLQAYTCVAVPNAVLWSGAKPVYVDINEDTFNMDPSDLKRKVTPKSRAIIVQHTFGQPVEMDDVLKIAEENNLVVIEDCAHALGAKYKGRKVGTLGDVAFFSFGRDKVISSVFGGMATTDNDQLAKSLRDYQQRLMFPKRYFVFSQLLHPIAFSVILPLYNILNIGKAILVLLQKFRLLSFPIFKEEKQGRQPKGFVSKLPNALAELALSQFKQLDAFLKTKREIVDFYLNNLRLADIQFPSVPDHLDPVYLRFTIRTKYADKIRIFAKKHDILLGNWYGVVSPEGVDLEKVGYKRGSCPIAEKISKLSLNLPTHPRMDIKDAERVVQIVAEYLESVQDSGSFGEHSSR